MPADDFVHEIEIAVPRARLHRFLCDLHGYLPLHPLIVSIDDLPPDPLRPQARRYRVLDRIPLGPFRIKARYVASLDPVSESEVIGRAWQSPGIEVRTHYALSDLGAGTRLVERVSIRAHWLLRRFVASQAQRAHLETLRKMKALLEGGAA